MQSRANLHNNIIEKVTNILFLLAVIDGTVSFYCHKHFTACLGIEIYANAFTFGVFGPEAIAEMVEAAIAVPAFIGSILALMLHRAWL
jgi:hypothetical protein